MSLLLGNVQKNVILVGNQFGNTLNANGIITTNSGYVGYINISGSPQSFSNIDSNIEYNNAIIDLNNLISNIGNLCYVSSDIFDIGSLSTSITPLLPGNYLFNNPISWNTTLYLSGNGQYVFYFMSTLTLGTMPIDGFMNLKNGVVSDDIFFYSPYDIILNTSTSNANIYGNFISDLSISDTSTGNFIVNGRFLSSTGNVTLTNNTFIPSDTACYTAGSLILVNYNELKKIEDLKITDKVCVFGKIKNNSVLEFHKPLLKDIKFFGKLRIRNIAKKNLPICFNINSLGSGLPFKKFEVSRGHRIILINTLIPCELLISNEISISENIEKDLIYYHIECDSHSIIMVNGILTETLYDWNSIYKNKFEKIFSNDD